MKTNDNLSIQIAVIGQKVTTIESTVQNIQEKLEGHYVTKEEFDPIKKVVYGMVTLILTSVLAALLAFILKGKV